MIFLNLLKTLTKGYRPPFNYGKFQDHALQLRDFIPWICRLVSSGRSRSNPMRNWNISLLKQFLVLSPILFFLLFSCKEKQVQIPANVYCTDSMAMIMVDIQLLEAMNMKKGIFDSLSKDGMLIQISQIFKKHNMTQEQFELSMDFYKANPVFLEKIYELTINEISQMQAILGNINISIADSIKLHKEMSLRQKVTNEIKNRKEKEEKSGAKKKNEITNGKKDTLPETRETDKNFKNKKEKAKSNK